MQKLSTHYLCLRIDMSWSLLVGWYGNWCVCVCLIIEKLSEGLRTWGSTHYFRDYLIPDVSPESLIMYTCTTQTFGHKHEINLNTLDSVILSTALA